MITAFILNSGSAADGAALQRFSSLLNAGPAQVQTVDGPGAAQAFNSAAAESTGDLLIFTRADVEFLARGFHSTLLEHMRHCDVLGVCGTTLLCDANWISAGLPYVYGQIALPNPKAAGWSDVLIWSVPQRRMDGMQALDGLFLCVRRSVLETLTFDAQSFCGRSGFDVDFTYRAYRAGFRLSVASDLFPFCSSISTGDADWTQAQRRFNSKFDGQLPAHLRQAFQTGIVSVPRRDEIVEVMSPAHWR